MCHYIENSGLLFSSYSNTKGSMNLWIKFIEKNPKFKFYSVNKSNVQEPLDINNLHKYWDNKASSVYSNSRILCKK